MTDRAVCTSCGHNLTRTGPHSPWVHEASGEAKAFLPHTTDSGRRTRRAHVATPEGKKP